MTPIEMFTRAVALWPEKIAVEAEGEKLSYAGLAGRVDAVAASLQAIDPEPGSRVGLSAYNSLDNLVSFLAIFAAGKVWVPLYPRLGAAALPEMAAFAEASIVITEPETRPHFERLGAKLVTLGEGRGEDTLAGLESDGQGRRPQVHPRPLEAIQALKFTGGTTGRPKGVMQSCRVWNTNIVSQIYAWGLGQDERTLLAAPMTHGAGTYILPTLASGGTLVIVDRLRPGELVETLATSDITTVFMPPTLIQTLADEPGAEGLSYPRLRNLIYAAAPMTPQAIEKAQAVFGPCIATTYGQTEAPQIATCLSPRELLRDELRASVGRETLLTRVAAMDGDGNLLPPGEVGEVVIRGDLVMTGYWRDPEKTAETIIDGWLHTGDLGAFDEAGHLFLKGRSREVIITGGFNVYPGDVEHVLAQHGSVADCAVFGVPDAKWGEAVHASVELKGAGDPQELMAHVKEALGSIKTPKAIHVYETLPRNIYGKLQRQALVDAVTAGGKKQGEG